MKLLLLLIEQILFHHHRIGVVIVIVVVDIIHRLCGGVHVERPRHRLIHFDIPTENAIAGHVGLVITVIVVLRV